MKKRLFVVNIKFDPAPNGSVYELKTAQLKVKAATKADAKIISEEWMANCWSFYRMAVSK